MVEVDQISHKLGKLEGEMQAVQKTMAEVVETNKSLQKTITGMQVRGASAGAAAGTLMSIATGLIMWQFKQEG